MKNLIYISHRGNINGRNPEMENHPDYIKKALDLGYDVEVDVWYKNNKFYLGHDEPQYEISKELLSNSKLWCHAKNIEVLNKINEFYHIDYFFTTINCFWHQNDDYTLTSHGYIWTYPNKPILQNCIAVLPELYPDWDISKAIGICSDYISRYK